MNIPVKKLNSRAEMPIVGLGTATIPKEKILKVLTSSYDVGYRHIDTADLYMNHKLIGEFLSLPNIQRDEIFITTKIWKDDLAGERVKKVLEKSLKDLQTDYVDLLLIHAPSKIVPISETLEAMRDLLEDNLINSIGVSNFNTQQIKEVVDVQKNWKTDFKIVNNQIEYHPRNRQEELRQVCFQNNIEVTAYSPLGGGEDMESETIHNLVDKYDKSPAQIILRWLVQKGMIVIPRSTEKEHLIENLELFDWKIEDKDIDRIDNPSQIVGKEK